MPALLDSDDEDEELDELELEPSPAGAPEVTSPPTSSRPKAALANLGFKQTRLKNSQGPEFLALSFLLILRQHMLFVH